MNTSVLLPLLSQVGAPLLHKLIALHLKEDKKKIGHVVVDTLSRALNVAPEPEAIVQAYRENPKASGKIIHKVDVDGRSGWLEILEVLQRETGINRTMRAEHAASALLTRIWRPIFGLVYAASFFGITVCLVNAILFSDQDIVNAFSSLSSLVISLYGMGASILGVYVWRRSDEKLTIKD